LPAPALESLPRRLRGRLAALSVLGALVVALPLGQVLRYQSAEMEMLAAQRAGLNPVTRTVDVQRGLIAHRATAAQVLGGDTRMEPERRVRQAEVDERLAFLAVALTTGPWDRAVRESDALRDDWLLLARDLMAGRVTVFDSEQAHRLLVEQTLQVLDLLADASTPRALRQGGDGTAMAWSAALALPRLVAQVSALSVPDAAGGPLASGRDIAAAEARLARTLGALNTALERPQAHPAPGAAELAAAGARAGAAADHYFQRLRAGNAPAEELQAAERAAVQAQFTLFAGVAAATRHGLDERLSEIAQRRSLLLAVTGALLLACALMLMQMLRGLKALGRPAVPPPGAPAPNADRVQAQRLLRRLRQGEDGAAPARASNATDAASEQQQPTLPPEH
jgi:hypothetical protein